MGIIRLIIRTIIGAIIVIFMERLTFGWSLTIRYHKRFSINHYKGVLVFESFSRYLFFFSIDTLELTTYSQRLGVI